MKKIHCTYTISEDSDLFVKQLAKEIIKSKKRIKYNESEVVDLIIDIVSGNFAISDVMKHYTIAYKKEDGRKNNSRPKKEETDVDEKNTVVEEPEIGMAC